MTASRPEQFFDAMSRHYAAQDFDAIADQFELPGALYIEDDVVVWKDRAALVDFLRQLCRCNQGLGARSVRPRVVAESLKAGNSYSVWVEWQHLDLRGHIAFVTQYRYFCRFASDGTPVIQLVELPKRPTSYLQDGVAAPFARSRHRPPRPHRLKRHMTRNLMAEVWRREA
jgi:hypothetical protein